VRRVTTQDVRPALLGLPTQPERREHTGESLAACGPGAAYRTSSPSAGPGVGGRELRVCRGEGVTQVSLTEKVQVLLLAVQTVTAVVLLWYALETRRLRQEAAKQTRLGIVPVVRVVLHRGPDKVFLENVGSGMATKAVLQGFRFQSDDGKSWRCTFEAIAGVLPGREAALRAETEMEGVEPPQSYVLNETAVFEHIRCAMKGKDSLVLALHWTDLLGTAYRSEVRIDRNRFYVFQDHGRPNPATTLPPEQAKSFPDSLDPV